MQPSEIISVNIWQILISLCNLVLIFLIIKKFLFKPVKNMLAQRQKAVDDEYAAAADAAKAARQDQAEWDEKMQGAEEEAQATMKKAADAARGHGDRVIAEAREKADEIIRQARAEAELEKAKSEASMKEEIVQVSTQLAEKMLEREIDPQDHRQLIDSFLENIGDAHD